MTIPHLLSLTITLLFIASCFSYSRSGSLMTDLTSPNPTADATSWLLTNTACGACPKTYTTPPNTCGIPQETIVGGPGILGISATSTNGEYFERVNSSLNAADAPAALEFDLWVFYGTVPNNPSNTNFFKMSVDGIDSSVVSISPSLASSCTLTGYTDAGGVTIAAFYKFHVRMLWTTVFRTDTRIKIISNMNVASTVSSFGFRDLQYYLGGSIPTAGPIAAANFPCASGAYWDGSTCIACYNTFCGVCTGTTKADCTSCKNAVFDYGGPDCKGSCSAPFKAVASPGAASLCQPACPLVEFFWFYNQSCSTTCDLPFSASTDANGLQICSNPCYYDDMNSVLVGKFLYPDQTCLSACDAPLVQKTPGLCISPCLDPANFIFVNGTCRSDCPGLLVGSMANTFSYCNSPCPNQFIYQDTSCATTCDPPLISITDSPDIKFCNSPCINPTDFLFANASCQAVCNPLLQQSTSHSIKLCKSPCPGQYIYSDGTCSNQCISPFLAVVDSADIKFCRSPCPNMNDYIFKNGSCTSQCITPLQDSSFGGYNLCNSPCPSHYIYIDGSCSLNCDAPLVRFEDSDDIKYCRSPCPATQYIFKNASCTSQCNSPLVQSTIFGNKFCNSPCPTQWIYTDGTCSSSCVGPLLSRTESVEIKWCRNPCASVSDYIFNNGTCQSSCNPLLVKSTTKGDHFCKSPCPGKYIYYDGTCQADCVTPMVKRDESADMKFCISPCKNSAEFYYEADQICLPTCTTPYELRKIYNMNLCFISIAMKVGDVKSTKEMVSGITGANNAGATGGKASVLMSSASPALAFMAGQVSLLFSIRYINVRYPSKLKLMFQLQGASPFSFSLDFSIPPGIKNDLGKKKLPDVFEQYEVPADFLENFWDSLLTLILTLVLIFVVTVVEKMFVKRFLWIKLILASLLRMMKWNLPLMILCSAFGDLFFFASLQFQAKGSGNTGWEIISLIVAIFMMIVGVIIVILPFRIVKEIQDSERQAEKKWKNFELLYSGNKRNSTLSFCYMAIFLSITVLSNIIITVLYENPLFEAFFMTGLSVLMLLFLFIQRPLTDVKMFVQIAINQLLLVVVDIFVVILAIMDNQGLEKEDMRGRIGQGIIIVFYISMASGIAFAVSEVLFSIWGFYKFIKALKAKGPLTVKRVLHALIHGIEEDIVEEGKKEDDKGTYVTTLAQPNADISKGKRQLNRWKKFKEPSQTRAREDWNNSETDLAQQNTDLSLSIPMDSQRDLSPALFHKKLSEWSKFQLPRNSSLDFSSMRVSKTRISKNMSPYISSPRKTMAREIIPQLQPVVSRNNVEQISYNSQFSLDIFYNKPTNAFERDDQMRDSARRPLNESLKPKRMANQEVSKAPSKNESHPQKRKNEEKPKKFFFN